MKPGGLNRHAQLKRRRRAMPGTADERERFKLAVCSRPCPITDDGPHEGPLQAHHVIAQEVLRRLARAGTLDDRQLAAILWDPRNGLSVCRRHHDRHTLAASRIPAGALDAEHRAFAAEHGLERYLAQPYYRQETDDAS